jgi:hypothetical protein
MSGVPLEEVMNEIADADDEDADDPHGSNQDNEPG